MNKLNKTILSNENGRKSASGITLIALVITIIVLLILAGVTIAMLTGSDSAPAKANEAKQANDIGTVKDEMSIAVQNAQMEAYDDVYVNNASTTKASKASETVGSKVIAKIQTQYPTNTEKNGVKITVADSGIITLETTDKKEYGQINQNGGALTWGVSKPTLGIGDSVNYSTTLNGQTLSNWKVFYIEGNYTYIILDDYLPNAYISDSIINTNSLSTYGVYGIFSTTTNRTDLLNAMEKSNWDSLLTGTINDTQINIDTTDENIWAMGSPTLDLWVNSWNAKYPSDTLYIAQTTFVTTDGLNGHKIGNLPSPTKTYISLSSNTGYNNELYFPHQERVDDDDCVGYWLASPAPEENANDCGSVRNVSYDGIVSSYAIDYPEVDFAFRPIIKIPTSVVNQ